MLMGMLHWFDFKEESSVQLWCHESEDTDNNVLQDMTKVDGLGNTRQMVVDFGIKVIDI